jgi:hypothetical protein
MDGMIVTADEQARIRLPDPARPGDAFYLEAAQSGQFILTRVAGPEQRVRLERKDGYLVAVTDKVITQAQTRKALDDFP